MWSHRHLLGIEELGADDAITILDRADVILEAWAGSVAARKNSILQGRTVINLFFEASTRTRTSFEMAGKRLGADVVNVSPATSSVVKGETLLDTVKNLEAMRGEILILRHQASGAPHFIAKRTTFSRIVNAGDGTHEHPTQALLDALTIRRKKGKIAGLTVAICGDILHSRVARSNALLLTRLGATVRFCGLKTMMPVRADAIAPVTVTNRIEEAAEGADVVMMLRVQSERFGSAMMSSTREYARTFGLNAAVLARAKPDAIVMHPGPINRGVEIDSRLADGERSVILDQVEAGVAVRAAVLELVTQAA